ncbi:MAG: hypothetical protein GWN67_04475 [Phycisphaerae bacterium]|nr:hypothetical protein [Phycisphaerae bacterium]NIP51178.1 hypothetical protein [Phycisphaerae bacterium]NIS50389.1 hypothetical protein [Phycisphaerae bacterium]NIU08119.1 hypothetical protein [Phycisphaerae bacterium]NIU55662.1 hypothetical protein [Phycisphaerae bacterium]
MIKRYYAHIAIYIMLGVTVYTCTADAKLPTLAVSNSFGVNTHCRGQPRDLVSIADTGFKFIKMDQTWESVEREKGVYDFEKAGYYDLTIRMLKTRCTHPVYLDYSNRLYESDRSVRTQQECRAFAAFADSAS